MRFTKYNFIVTLLLFTSIAAIILSCEQSTNPEEDTIVGSWIMIKYQDLNSNTIRFQPKTVKNPIWVRFNEDSTVIGHTETNRFWGEYELRDVDSIGFKNMYTTLVGETLWGKKFKGKFSKSNRYDFKGDSLFLFSDNDMGILSFIDSVDYDHEVYQAFGPDVQYFIHEEFQRYFGNFNKDSWWLYKEVSTNKYDSMYVSKINTEQWYYDDSEISYYETIYYEIESTVNDDLYCYVYSVYQGEASNFAFYYPVSIGLGVSYEDNKYQISCDCGRCTFIDRNCDTQVDVINSMEINGIEYNDVIKTYGTETFNENPIIAAYYVKDIGLVKKEYLNGEIYDLSDYEIKE